MPANADQTGLGVVVLLRNPLCRRVSQDSHPRDLDELEVTIVVARSFRTAFVSMDILDYNLRRIGAFI